MKKIIIPILGGIIVAGGIYAGFAYSPNKTVNIPKPLATSEEIDTGLESCPECSICEECICPTCQPNETVCEPEIITKEIIKEVEIVKEVPVEKIVYQDKIIYKEANCPDCNSCCISENPDILSDVLHYTRNGINIYKSQGEDFEMEYMIFEISGDLSTKLSYSIDAKEVVYLGQFYGLINNKCTNNNAPTDCFYYSSDYYYKPSLYKKIFPEGSEIVFLKGDGSINGSPTNFKYIRLKGVDTGKIITLP